MPKSIARTYSRYTEDALAVLASLIRSASFLNWRACWELLCSTRRRVQVDYGVIVRYKKKNWPCCRSGSVSPRARSMITSKLNDYRQTYFGDGNFSIPILLTSRKRHESRLAVHQCWRGQAIGRVPSHLQVSAMHLPIPMGFVVTT